MALDFTFNSDMIGSLIGGGSALQIPRLNVHNMDEAYAFFRTYGYDLQIEEQEQLLWNYHGRAVTYLKTELLNDKDDLPIELTDPSQLKDLSFLLIYASTRSQTKDILQIWSCAILRVMHVLVHLDNDLFAQFSHQIKEQILKPITSHIIEDPVSGISLGKPSDPESIVLKKFTTKAFKTSASSVTKLLARPEKVAFSILDKIGVRIVTKHLFDVFAVLRYLMRKNIISYPHHIPDQSNNTLYPTNLFLELMESLVQGTDVSRDEVDSLLKKKLEDFYHKAEFLEKTNAFSGQNYKFIKFITRKLIRIPSTEEGRTLSFFYPYEVQILDYETYLKNLSGPSSHEEYKIRQKKEARERVLGLKS